MACPAYGGMLTFQDYEKQSVLRLTQIRFTGPETTFQQENVTKTISETRQETCCWTLCYGMWWNVELLWGLLISPGRNTAMMWMLREKLWKMAYLANGRHTIPPTRSSFLKFGSLQLSFLTVNHIKLHFPVKTFHWRCISCSEMHEGYSLTCWH